MVKTWHLFKKAGDVKGAFHAKTGMINGRNSMDLTETEEIKKKWQEYAEELWTNSLNDPDNHNGVVTHLEANILEYEVKRTLGSITMNKDNRGNRTPAVILNPKKMIKVLHSVCQQI